MTPNIMHVLSCFLIERNPENMCKNPMCKSQTVDSHVTGDMGGSWFPES